MTLVSVIIPPDHGKGTSKKTRRERRLRDDLFKKQSGNCYWCGEPMELEHFKLSAMVGRVKENPRFATFEHLLPKSHGGRTCGNVVLAHGSCNHNRHKRKFAHDPIYGNGTDNLPTPLNYPRQKKKRRRKAIFAVSPAPKMVLRGGFWMEKS